MEVTCLAPSQHCQHSTYLEMISLVSIRMLYWAQWKHFNSRMEGLVATSNILWLQSSYLYLNDYSWKIQFTLFAGAISHWRLNVLYILMFNVQLLSYDSWTISIRMKSRKIHIRLFADCASHWMFNVSYVKLSVLQQCIRDQRQICDSSTVLVFYDPLSLIYYTICSMICVFF
jgi:hypothetical protein